ncbi:Bacterial DnaG primase, TOPRIM domain [uncultured Caudovirales phage]|uniref:Bacterial DnaG primase, TOPRIM domain n=1 Tax=uncultured Caudovirales phage TaxID=2100421 RepID=A0A6J5LYJ7_9CAUD|nr:Bacterial DnaG primase, TOPRIM domain [uncultured Caudovirales phage]CAB4148084.1 Bacterial DnaG primase, TOPRIM domain [uncultured Caudovirales phage]
MQITFDVVTALDALGVDYDVRGNEANSLCPQHFQRTGKADNSPSWWINLSSGMHTCFSCGYKGNLIQLVCDVKELYIQSWGDIKSYDYQAAKDWLKVSADVSVEQLMEQLKDLPNYINGAPKPLEMSEARLAVFTAPPEAQLEGRKITPASAEKYGVLWDTVKQSWVLPLREPHFNKLMGWQEKGTVDRTFFNRPTGLPKSKTLFGVDVQNEQTAIVVESPLDCLRIESAGITGAVAICGSSISEDQVKLLRYSSKVIAAFDNPNVDNAGRKASKEMLGWGRKYGLNLFFFNYGDTNKKDPGDMTDEEIRWGVENAVTALFGESAYVQGNTQTVSG